jgi:hypothetical protein
MRSRLSPAASSLGLVPMRFERSPVFAWHDSRALKKPKGAGQKASSEGRNQTQRIMASFHDKGPEARDEECDVSDGSSTRMSRWSWPEWQPETVTGSTCRSTHARHSLSTRPQIAIMGEARDSLSHRMVCRRRRTIYLACHKASYHVLSASLGASSPSEGPVR